MAYLVVPIAITLLGQDEVSLWVFGFMSAGALLIAGFLL